MTVLASGTLVEQQAELMRQLNDVLKQHEIGRDFRIMFAPPQLDVAEDEVLVQVVNPEKRMVEIHPRRLTELHLGDTIHATQVIDPSDEAFGNYSTSQRATTYLKTTRPDGSKGHLMVP
ncbi:hypothetical protein [Streptomyces sp. NPDC006140]|uniref:hypothetical protein n=1 Tax=Streptomyces sp. NPDC006140 TaxID=3154579 RepID=UPI0033D233A2